MDILEERNDTATILKLEGRLDAKSSPEVEKRLQALLGQGVDTLIIDFTATGYVSSAGLRVMLTAAKQLKASQGRLILSGMDENVLEVFRMIGFHRILDIRDTLQDALAAAS